MLTKGEAAKLQAEEYAKKEAPVRKLIEIVPEPEDVERSTGASLWIVKGRLYIQTRLNVQGEYAMEESHRTFNVVVRTPYLAAQGFLLKASEACGPLQLVVGAQVDSVKWSAWVDAGVKV